MNSDEHQLINGLFDRMRANGSVEKDRDAEALINQSVRQIPDSAYMLVQSVLVQEHALQQAGSRIEELEAQVRDLEQSRGSGAAAPAGGFLGGLFGGGRSATQPVQRASVPSMGGRVTAQSGGSPWGSAPGYQAGQPGGQQAGMAPQAQPAPAQGGGFMKSAMATAAGVAGGMLLANSISGMLGGNSGSQAHAATPGSTAESGTGDYGNIPAAENQSDPSGDASYQDASSDDSGWGDAGDMDI